MFPVSSDVLDAFASDSREIYVKATFNGTHIIDGEYIKTFNVDDSVSSSSDSLALGSACSAKLTLDMFVPPSDGYTYTDINTGEVTTYTSFPAIANAEIFLEVGVEVSGTVTYIPIGLFIVDSYETKNHFKSVNITAFDAMLLIDRRLGNNYTCSLRTTNVSVMDILKDILTQANISTDYIPEPYTVAGYGTYLQESYPVTYSSTGAKSTSNTSKGMSYPFKISANAEGDIDFILVSDSSTFPTSMKVLYFSDAACTNLLSYNSYDVDTSFPYDAGLGWQVSVEKPLPTHSSPIYVVFCAPVSNFDTSDLKLYIGVDNGYTTTATNYVNYTVTVPNPVKVDFSARTMLGYMAGVMGCNAKFDRYGHFTLKRIGGNSVVRVRHAVQYMDGFDKTREGYLTIHYLTTGSEPNSEGVGQVITVGNGSFGFNFENPYIPLANNMTPSTVAQNILDLYDGLSFTSGSVKYRYNPSFDCGDVLSIEADHEGSLITYNNLIVLGHKISMTGGLSAVLECNVSTDVKKDFVSTPSSKKLTQRLTDFDARYKNIISVLTGISGGYVKEVRDSQDNIRALAITASDIEVAWDSANEKVVRTSPSAYFVPMWVWSLGGLSFSNTEGSNYETAITMEGNIVANMIQGQLGYYGNLTAGGFNVTQNSLSCSAVSGGTTYMAYINKYLGTISTNSAFGIKVTDSNNNVTYPVVIRYNGELIATNATITGNITATSGKIGGWDINSNFLRSASGSTGNTYTCELRPYSYSSASSAGEHGAFVIQVYNASTQTYSYPLNIRYDGTLNASKANITGTINATSGSFTGTINATSGEIGGWTIDGSVLKKVIGNYRIRLGSTGYPLNIVDDSTGEYNFQITDNGDIHTKESIRFDNLSAGTLMVDSDHWIYVTISSKRFKENISNKLSDSLNPKKLYDVEVVEFDFKEGYKAPTKGKQIGFIAEELDKSYSPAVIYDENDKPINWSERIMIPAMLKLIQEQKSEIDDLKERVSKLEGVINKLTKE